MKTGVFCAVITSLPLLLAAAPKPIPDGYTADPSIRVFGDTSSPTGPFVDALGRPLLDRKADPRITTNTIDPYPLIDDDGDSLRLKASAK